MTIHNQTKINQLLQHWPYGTVATAHWLEQLEISRQLQAHYLKSGWIESIGVGAFKRTGDTIGWKGGVFAIQQQVQLPIHVGGLTAIVLQGAGHYIRFKENVQLFTPEKVLLPSWFKHYNWEDSVTLHRTGFLTGDVGLKQYEDKNFSITIATLERAILECLYLAPKHMDLVECYHIMEGLVGLQPDVLQELLEKCSSIKVKRLFLYMAEKANHTWLQFMDIKNIDLGKGKRSLVKQGIYNTKYQITLPKELGDL